MSQIDPFAFRYDGEGDMKALRVAAADRTFVIGRIYWLVEAKLHEATDASRRHMFAVLNKAFQSLPESLHDLYPNMDALRKRALITAGFYEETEISGATPAQSGQLVTSLRRQNSLSHVRIEDGVVYQRTAKSIKDMERDEFERAKQAIFEIVAELIGVTVDELTRQGD